jgi:hypothetical protein
MAPAVLSDQQLLFKENGMRHQKTTLGPPKNSGKNKRITITEKKAQDLEQLNSMRRYRIWLLENQERERAKLLVVFNAAKDALDKFEEEVRSSPKIIAQCDQAIQKRVREQVAEPAKKKLEKTLADIAKLAAKIGDDATPEELDLLRKVAAMTRSQL